MLRAEGFELIRGSGHFLRPSGGFPPFSYLDFRPRSEVFLGVKIVKTTPSTAISFSILSKTPDYYMLYVLAKIWAYTTTCGGCEFFRFGRKVAVF